MLSRRPLVSSSRPRPGGMAAAIWSFWPVSMRARPLASRSADRCSRPRTPMITGVSRPIRVRVGPSPMPTNLLTAEASMASPPPPSNDDRRLVPLSATCADPVRLLAMLPKMSVGCSATAFASCRAPPGLAATSANTLNSAGTAAATAFCAVPPSKPVAEASLPTISGVRNREMVDTMSLVMEGSLPSSRPCNRATSCAHDHGGGPDSPERGPEEYRGLA